MNNLKERRLALGLTQTDVVARLKEIDRRIDAPMLSRFEQGVCLPTENVLRCLEEVLQAPRTELYDTLSLVGVERSPREQRPMTAVLADLIPRGRRNAISRRALASQLRMSDRQMRKHIEDARVDGLIIANEQNGRGYYQPDDISEVRLMYEQQNNRLKSIYASSKPMRDFLLAAGQHV